MPLKKIQEDLPKKYSKYARRRPEKTSYHEEKFEEDVQKKQKTVWERLYDRLFATKIRAIISGVIILLIVIIISLSVVGFVYYQRSFFKQENVSLILTAPDSAKSNDLVEIAFEYTNKNRASLSNAEIKVEFGKYFIPIEDQSSFKVASLNSGVIEVGNIRSYGKGKITIAGYFVGPENFIENVQGTLSYQPAKTSAIYSTQGKSSTTINSSPIVIDFDSPQEIVSGSSLDLIISCRNTSRESIKNIKLIMEYPDNFSFKSEKPDFAQDKVWFIGELLPQEEKEFRLKGVLSGKIGTFQKFKAQVETQATERSVVYAIHEYAAKIINAPIALSQYTNQEVVYAGNELNYTVEFSNDANIPIRDAILKLQFEDEVLDFSELKLDRKGFYDKKNKTIIWKASDVPALKLLEPNESGEVNFTIPVKKELPIQDTTDANFTIETRASIDSEDIPSPIRDNKTILTNVLLIKLGSYVPFEVTGKYKEGELPPRVGKETIYTLTMEVGSYNNDLKEVEISAVLPTGVSWKKNVTGDKKDKLSFNERANAMVWKVGGVTHGEGFLSPTQKISFDVSIIPSVDQAGKSPILIKDINLDFMDVFTGENFYKDYLTKTINLKEDDETQKGNNSFVLE